MKLRSKALAAYQGEMADIDGKFTRRPDHVLMPMIMPGGPLQEQHNIESYRQSIMQSLRTTAWGGEPQPLLELLNIDIPEAEIRVGVVYRWRSKRHLTRWLRQQQSRKRGKGHSKVRGWWRGI